MRDCWHRLLYLKFKSEIYSKQMRYQSIFAVVQLIKLTQEVSSHSCPSSLQLLQPPIARNWKLHESLVYQLEMCLNCIRINLKRQFSRTSKWSCHEFIWNCCCHRLFTLCRTAMILIVVSRTILASLGHCCAASRLSIHASWKISCSPQDCLHHMTNPTRNARDASKKNLDSRRAQQRTKSTCCKLCCSNIW